jgi:hypothetical protein
VVVKVGNTDLVVVYICETLRLQSEYRCYHDVVHKTTGAVKPQSCRLNKSGINAELSRVDCVLDYLHNKREHNAMSALNI